VDLIETNCFGHLKKSPMVVGGMLRGWPRAAIEGAILELPFKRRRVARFVGDHFRSGQSVVIGGRFQGGRSIGLNISQNSCDCLVPIS
jgi:hypothetical protein